MCFEIGYKGARIRFIVEGAYVDKTYNGNDYNTFVKDVKDEFFDWASDAILKSKDYRTNDGSTVVDCITPQGTKFTEYVRFEIEGTRF